MSSRWYAIDLNLREEGFTSFLPHVAGVIENVEEATFPEIKRQVETDLNKKISEKDIATALESGIKLGLFTLKREFKVCKEFSTKDIQKIRSVEQNITDAKGADIAEPCEASKEKRRGKTLKDYVKYEREQRRKKSVSKKRRRENLMMANDFKERTEFYKYLCRRCKKSLEKEVMRRQRSLDREDRSPPYSGASSLSMRSQIEEGDKKLPEKSKLLIEKNPMETEPPYYDIFT